MKKPAYPGPLVGKIFRKIAPRIGAKVVMETEWNIAGQIIYKSGKKRYFRYSSLDLNTLGAAEISKDKDYANFFMKRMGYPTVPGKTFFAPKWAEALESPRSLDAAYAYAQEVGFPVIVKPNSGSQGKGVALCHTRRDFYSAMRRIFKLDRVALVQTPVKGRDYRIVVLDDKVISAYERIPLNVIGDGHSTIAELLEKKQRRFSTSSRDTRLRMEDPRIKAKLAREKLTLQSVPVKGQRVYLLDNANLSAGGDAVDVTNTMHPGFRQFAIKSAEDMGLRLCGVDLMIEGDITKSPEKYWVLEINSAPGLDHYVKTGKAQQKIVEDMYLEVLKHMER
ncbi:MAG: cyanophycin synthetase [Patescibacteria group bacterium]|nr:cyanophycin synthetase [Patescibacteria group bacterium]